MAKGRGLVAVGLIMATMILGAFAVQYYGWTTPLQVRPLTTTTTLSTENEAGAVHNGSESWTGPNVTLPVGTGENYKIGIRVSWTAGTLAAVAHDLTITVTLGTESRSTSLVTNGTEATSPFSLPLFVGPNNLGYAPGITLSSTITVSENTMPVTSDTLANILLQVWAQA